MYITITVQLGDEEASLKIDNRQEIQAAIEILRESGRWKTQLRPDYYRSDMRERMVSAYKTFEEEKIYDGDRLTAVLWEDGKEWKKELR